MIGSNNFGMVQIDKLDTSGILLDSFRAAQNIKLLKAVFSNVFNTK